MMASLLDASRSDDIRRELEALFAQAGVDLDVRALDSLLDGVEAAPAARDPDAWIDLVVPRCDGTMKGAMKSALLRYQAVRASRTTKRRTVAEDERLAALRARLRMLNLDGFLVPRADEHQGEFVAKRSERLAWLTGFTGSAGLAVVLVDKAALFVDGRYVLQARRQVDTRAIAPVHIADMTPEAWIEKNLVKGARLGYDPWLLTRAQVERFAKAAARAGGELVPVAENPVDAVWPDQPPPPVAPVRLHPLAYAGRNAADKRAEIATSLRAEGLDAAVLTLPDSIAWLLNIRGGDVPHTPVTLAFAVLYADASADLFVDPRKVTADVRRGLGNEVRVRPPDEFGPALNGLKGKAVRVDPATAPAWVFDCLAAAGADLRPGDDPCQLPKSCKNAVELEGARRAHTRDGVALVRFLAWLDREAPKGTLTEMDVAAKLAAFRMESDLIRDLSFDTIAGAGPNGAIVHYRVTPETNRRIEPGNLLLVDSGAQYLDGTTDVTRTIVIGTPTSEMKDRFTRVLKGHIAIAMARFPRGTTGSALDALARTALWQAGLDYDHGTGHGVGSYLGVHEGPQRIAKVVNTVALRPGMIVSNEPGYYKEGAFGIRIENLVAVVPSKATGDEREMLAFETLTMAPIDRRLVESAFMTAAELAWLDAYHARVCATLGPLVDPETARWLEAATHPLSG